MMADKELTAPQGSRTRTDKSLKAERARTDESLSVGRKKAEKTADARVLKGRAEADKATTAVRNAADELSGSDSFLRDERLNADSALKTERNKMDAALVQERSENGAEQFRLFQQERTKTDKNLTDERLQSDSDVQAAGKDFLDERALHTATKAALTTRDEFLAIVSHDLRNPLAAISVAVDLLRDCGANSKREAEGNEYLNLIERNAREGLRIISDLLDVERIATNKLALQIETQSIGAILQHAIETFRPLAAKRNISIELESVALSLMAQCDRDRVSQILSNLIGNALKFTPKAGLITLRALQIDAHIQVEVSDSGPGIPPELHKTIFERFSQIGHKDRRGLGLGLFISTMLVEAQGGRIWADSKVGVGSTFCFTLPSLKQ